MKILFFSDAHGGENGLRTLTRRIAELRPDRIVLLGDALYHGPRNPIKGDYAPNAAVELLNGMKSQLLAVRGNCDSEVDQLLLEFPMMGDYALLSADGTDFFLTHGHLWSPERPPAGVGRGCVFASGHTHCARLEKLDSGVIALNPGSISLPKDGRGPSFAWAENSELSLRDLATGLPFATRQL